MEFGTDAGKMSIIVWALYGLKSACASFQRHLADCMRTLGYKSCMADVDLWSKTVVRPDDGLKYYTYSMQTIAYVFTMMRKVHEIDRYFPMKKGSIGNPDIYLGPKRRIVTLCNGSEGKECKSQQACTRSCEELRNLPCEAGQGNQVTKKG